MLLNALIICWAGHAACARDSNMTKQQCIHTEWSQLLRCAVCAPLLDCRVTLYNCPVEACLDT